MADDELICFVCGGCKCNNPAWYRGDNDLASVYTFTCGHSLHDMCAYVNQNTRDLLIACPICHVKIDWGLVVFDRHYSFHEVDTSSSDDEDDNDVSTSASIDEDNTLDSEDDGPDESNVLSSLIDDIHPFQKEIRIEPVTYRRWWYIPETRSWGYYDMYRDPVSKDLWWYIPETKSWGYCDMYRDPVSRCLWWYISFSDDSGWC